MNTHSILEYFSELIANECGITVLQLKGSKRKQEYVTARQIFCYMARKYTTVTKSDIGRFLGNKHHTTVIHSLREFEHSYRLYDDVKTLVKTIEEKNKFKSQVADDLVKFTIDAIKDDPNSVDVFISYLYNHAFEKGRKLAEEVIVKTEAKIINIKSESEKTEFERPKAVYSNKSWI